jgi:putative membrane-bound dehydrogenase-like protein
MILRVGRALPLFLGFFLAASQLRAATVGALIPAGVARIDISPTNAVRLMGYAARADIAAPTNVLQRLHARALAIGEGSNAVVIVTIDNCILPGALTSEIRARVAARTGMGTNQIALAVTHTHSAPCLTGAAPNIFARDISPPDQAEIDTYTRYFAGKVEESILTALNSRQPAQLAWGQGRVGFARNRRTPGGPVDHSLPLLRISGPDGRLRGILVNYACHCTTLSGDFNASHGDWAGVAALDLEASFPGATALVAIGCGADSNPDPRGTVALVEQHGRSLANEARRLIELPLTPLANAPVARLETIELPFQPHFSRGQWESRARTAGIVGHHARRWLARIDAGNPPATTLPYPVQSFAFGDQLAMVFLGGEVVVDYSLRLKTELDSARLWINGYANDVPCYIPSRRILREGGYEAESSLWYYDRPQQLDPAIEDRIIESVRGQLEPIFRRPPAKGEMTPPREARRALESFSLPSELTLDLVAGDDLVQSPVAIDFAADGRLWVCEMSDYPAGMKGGFEPGGRVKVLTDVDRDGRFDHATVVASGLPFPTGLMAWQDGVIVCAAPDVLWFDGAGGGREVLLSGFATHNYQARVNGLRWGLDGWVYGSGGLFGGRIRSPGNATEIDASGRDFRFMPRAAGFEPLPGVSQQGRVRDDFNEWFGNDNGSLLWHYPLPPDAAAWGIEPPQARIGINRDDNRVFPTSVTLARFNDPHTANQLTSACAPELYRDTALGAAYAGNAFVCEPVHNLVRRAVLARDGVTFTARRATNELNSEFLSSSDNWFRPVEIRTGPDGALWVVDMYRFVIEHTRWIPPERLQQLDPRAGADRGRIYRIRRRDDRLRPLPTVREDRPAQLASRLGSSNGVLRDLAHRELLVRHRASPIPIPALRQLLSPSSEPAIRAQAAAVLSQLKQLRVADFTGLLEGREPRLSRFVLGLLPAEPAALELLRSHSAHLAADPFLRLALAGALERQGAAGAGDVASLLLDHPADPWLRAVALRAAANHPEAFVSPLLARPDWMRTDTGAWSTVLDRIVADGNPNALSDLILAAPASTESPSAALGWIARLDPRAHPLLRAPARARMEGWRHELLPIASEIATGIQYPVPERNAAVLILSQSAATDPLALAKLVGLLETELPDPVRATLVNSLANLPGPGLPSSLLNDWTRLPPRSRTERIRLLLSRPTGCSALLEAVREGRVLPTELTIEQREQLRRHKDPAIRDRATTLLATVTSNRGEVLDRFRPALTMEGDAGRGAPVFDRLCSACHRVRDRGHAVGPDITVYRSKAPEDLLVAILDPNAAVDARSSGYTLSLKDGRELTGVVVEETAAALTLVQPGGNRTRFARSEVDRLEVSSRSLMPEGLEEGLAPQDLADLMAWLRRSPGVFGAADAATQSSLLARWGRSSPAPLERLGGSNPPLSYPSWMGTFPLHFCRQNLGQDRLSWETTVPPGTGRVTLRWPAAMGLQSTPKGHFTLNIAGQPALDFDVTLEDAEWTARAAQIVLRYRVEERNDEDSNGVLEIEIDRARVPADGRLRLSIQASNSGSQRWFGVYAVPPR